MELEKTLNSILDIIFEALKAIYLFPKTIWKVFVAKNFFPQYVSEELEKKPELRFERYLSPLKLAVMSYLVLIFIGGKGTTHDSQHFGGFEFKNLQLIFLLVNIIPFVASIIPFLAGKEKFENDIFRKNVFILTYIFQKVFIPSSLFILELGYGSSVLNKFPYYISISILVLFCLIFAFAGGCFLSAESEVRQFFISKGFAPIYAAILSIGIMILYFFLGLSTIVALAF